MNTIKKLREQKGYSQIELAEAIGVTRATIIDYEKDSSKIPAGRVALIADFFEVNCDCIINNTEPEVYGYNVTTEAKNNDVFENSMRIDIPQENIDKFKEVLLYITTKIGALPHVGQTVLYKLLYFIDFDFYEIYEEQLIGAKYIKNTFGPSPVDFAKITKKMAKNNELSIVEDEYFTKKQTKYLPRREANLSKFSAIELAHIDNCIAKYGKMNATQLSDYSHKDVPWIGANIREQLDYEAVFYRTPETSVRVYED